MTGGPMAGHTAIVTGANHGIGAATALALGQRGCAVLCTFLRVDDPADPGTPQAYRDHRRQDAEPVAAQIRAQGGRAIAIEADLSDPGIPAILFRHRRGPAGTGEHPGEQRHWVGRRHVRAQRRGQARSVTPAGQRRDVAAAVHRRCHGIGTAVREPGPDQDVEPPAPLCRARIRGTARGT